MSLASPTERSVGWALTAVLTLAAGASVAFDLLDDTASSTVETGASDAAGDGVVAGDGDEGATSGAVAGGRRSFTIAATGELLVHESVANAAATGGGWDFTPMFAAVKPIISGADLAVCHVETPMSPDNTGLSYYPAFNVPNQLADAIADTGYDTCSTASNHSLDTGRAGVEGTINALDRVGVAHTGTALSSDGAATVNLIDVAGVTVAHLSYTYGVNEGTAVEGEPYLANLVDEDAILAEAARARTSGARFVILSLHWGSEYVAAPDASQIDLGPRLLSAPSIDLILGHAAHVIQPVTTVEGEVLVYGMGNFLSNQAPESCTGCPPGTQDGVIMLLTVTEDDAGRFEVTAMRHVPTWVDRTTYEIVPVLDDPGGRDPTVLADSAERTATALAALGTTVVGEVP